MLYKKIASFTVLISCGLAFGAEQAVTPCSPLEPKPAVLKEVENFINQSQHLNCEAEWKKFMANHQAPAHKMRAFNLLITRYRKEHLSVDKDSPLEKIVAAYEHATKTYCSLISGQIYGDAISRERMRNHASATLKNLKPSSDNLLQSKDKNFVLQQCREMEAHVNRSMREIAKNEKIMNKRRALRLFTKEVLESL